MNESSPDSVLLKEIAESLREMLMWTRVTGRPVARQILREVLDSKDKRLVYQLLDGNRSVAEIQAQTGVNARYISEWGQDWERIGVVTPSRASDVRGRRHRVFDLLELDIEV